MLKLQWILYSDPFGSQARDHGANGDVYGPAASQEREDSMDNENRGNDSWGGLPPPGGGQSHQSPNFPPGSSDPGGEDPYGGFSPEEHDGRTGPPWEDFSRGLSQRWLKTVKGVYVEPIDFFDKINLDRGLGWPLLFCVIGIFLGTFFTNLYSLFTGPIFADALKTLIETMGQDAPDVNVEQFVTSKEDFIIALISSPFMAILGLFISSAIIHLLLMLFGGANKSFEATFRAIAYTEGAMALLMVVPVCGALLTAVWSIIVKIIAVSRVHGCSAWAAAFAVLVPFLVCCLCIASCFAMFAVAGLAVGLQ
jgi:hypothetical protein